MIRKLFFTLSVILGVNSIFIAQTTHVIDLATSGQENRYDVTCEVGDILEFRSSSAPFAIKIFRDPGQDLDLQNLTTATQYYVTEEDTSYSSIISLAPTVTQLGSITITVPETPNSISENNLKDVNIYPNPATNEIGIINLPAETRVDVVDVTGKIVKSLTTIVKSEKINISELNTGVYYLKIKGLSYRFVKN